MLVDRDVIERILDIVFSPNPKKPVDAKVNSEDSHIKWREVVPANLRTSRIRILNEFEATYGDQKLTARITRVKMMPMPTVGMRTVTITAMTGDQERLPTGEEIESLCDYLHWFPELVEEDEYSQSVTVIDNGSDVHLFELFSHMRKLGADRKKILRIAGIV